MAASAVESSSPQQDVTNDVSKDVQQQQPQPLSASSVDFAGIITTTTNDTIGETKQQKQQQQGGSTNCCTICLETYSIDDIIAYSKNVNCNHVFHKTCIIEWIQNSTHTCIEDEECPICRSKYYYGLLE